MKRDNPEFREAVDRVKISHFVEMGLDITGIVHVGANDGYEVQWYRKMGIAPILCFEPLPLAIEAFKAHYQELPDVTLHQFALGNVNGTVLLNVAINDGQGSSTLCEMKEEGHITGVIPIQMHRFSSLLIDCSPYNCLVIDTQGTELDVLKGFDDQIREFAMLNIECSEVPIYKGGAHAEDVITYLGRYGFDRVSPICTHDDIFFVRKPV